MKKKFLVGLIGFFILGIVEMAEAVPMCYTFEGVITDTYADPGWNGPGSFPDDWENLKRGLPISFTYLIDLETFDIDDPFTYNVELTDWNNHFFVNTGMSDEVISTSIFQTWENGGYIKSQSQYNFVNFGLDLTNDFDWELGNDIIAGTSWDRQAGYLGYDWTASLTEIAVPVPEPTTMLLFASGLIGLAGFRRRFRKS